MACRIVSKSNLFRRLTVHKIDPNSLLQSSRRNMRNSNVIFRQIKDEKVVEKCFDTSAKCVSNSKSEILDKIKLLQITSYELSVTHRKKNITKLQLHVLTVDKLLLNSCFKIK